MPASPAQKISLAARKLLDKHGPSGVTMRNVAAAVGVTPMALYRHYRDRDALLNAVADAGFADLAATLEALRLTGSTERQLMKILDTFLDHALATPQMFELMFLTRREGARRFPQDFKAGLSPTANVSHRVIVDGMASGYLRKGDAWAIVFETGALMEGLIMLYLGGRVAMTPAEFRKFVHQTFRRYLHGICS